MARQVTYNILTAWRHGKAKRQGNMETDGVSVWLHGNEIARRVGDRVYVCDGGYPSRTTHERLRAIGLSVGFHKGEQRIYAPGRHLYGDGQGALKHGEYWAGEWIVLPETRSRNMWFGQIPEGASGAAPFGHSRQSRRRVDESIAQWENRQPIASDGPEVTSSVE